MFKVIIELIGRNRLILQKIFGNGNQLLAVVGKNLAAFGGGSVENGLDLFVDDAGSLFGIALGGAEVTPDKDAPVGGIKHDRSEALAHTVTHHHVSCNGGSLLDITGGTGGDIIQEDLFSYTAAESHHDVFIHLSTGFKVLQIFLRAEKRKPACSATGNNGNIVDGIHIL